MDCNICSMDRAVLQQGFATFGKSKYPTLLRPVFVILLLINALWAVSQPQKQHTFTHYTMEMGLVSNQVNSILQDETGYIWIATNDGLTRFDGIRYKTFRHNESDPFSIPGNRITQLISDKKKNCWLLMGDGKAGIFDTRKLVFKEAAVIPKNESSLKSPLKKLITDEFGNIFLLLPGNELLVWNELLNEFSPTHNFIPVPREWKINDIIQQPGTRRYWMNIQGMGFAVYDDATGKISSAGDNAEKIAAIDHFKHLVTANCFYFDRKGRFWFAGADNKYSFGYCYDFNSKAQQLSQFDFVSVFKSYYDINGFFEQKDGTVWLRGFKAFGYFSEKTKQFTLIPAGNVNEKDIDYRYISCLFEDREHNIWVGTGNNGAFRFNPSLEFFTNISHISRETGVKGDGNPISFFKDKDGSVLVGMWNDGLYRFDSAFNNIPLKINGIDDNNGVYVYNIFPSERTGTVWFASQPGIYAYDPQKREAVFYNPPLLENRGIREIAEDKHGNLWIGLQRHGVFKWDAVKGSATFNDGISAYTPIPQVQIQQITIDKKGWVWISTAVSGVYVIDPDSDKVIMHFHSKGSGDYKLPEEGVSAVMDYSDSLMVIATSHHIMLYNKFLKKTSQVTNDGTVWGDIASMQKDGSGNLWIGTTSGLYRANIKKKVFISFDRNDGIVNDYFIQSSSYALPDGKMLFGSSAHIVLFDPDEIKLNISSPQICITDFKLLNKSLPVDSIMHLKQVTLDHTQNSLNIDFSTLTFNSLYAILYKLEGLDNEWKTADDTRQVIYSYLAPGDYKLVFSTIDSEGRNKRADLELRITVSSPYWQTWWFYSLIMLVVVAILYWLDRLRLQRIRDEQQVRVSIASNLHKDVNTTLRNINVLSEIAYMKSGTQPEQAKDYIQEIQHKSRNMVIAMNDVLWSIDPANDSMLKTIERLRDIAASMRGDNITAPVVEVSDTVSLLKLDMKTRTEFITIYKLMLSLLIEKMYASMPVIELDYIRPILQLKVFSEDTILSKNDGIVNSYIDEIKTRAANIGATVEMETGTKGTMFLLEVRI